MNHHNFFLQPFSPVSPLLNLQITGKIGRRANTLAIQYALLGHQAELAIPSPADAPARKNHPWKGTCLRLFLAAKNSPNPLASRRSIEIICRQKELPKDIKVSKKRVAFAFGSSYTYFH